MNAIPVSRAAGLVASFAAGLLLLGAGAQAQDLDVPYVPTPVEIVDKMLDLASVGKNDVVYDLGCGDGRIVIRAATERGARGTGIDHDPSLVEKANANARQAGVADRAVFVVGDLFDFDFSKASVVTLYLLPDVNEKLRPYLWRQLKVGTRVVSHDYDMGAGWPPEKVVRMGKRKVLYYWTIREEHKVAVGLKG
jgi:SAM-dependent methyltransferase